MSVPQDPRGPKGALVVALGAGVVAGLVAFGTTLAVGGPSTLAIAMAGALPSATAHDFSRYSYLAAGLPRRAAVLDGAWLAISAAGLGAAFLLTDPGSGCIVAIWGSGALVAVAPAVVRATKGPGSPTAREWLSAHRPTWQPLFFESLLLVVSGNLTLLAIGAMGGLSDLGQFRAGQVAFGPIITFAAAIQVASLRTISTHRASPREARRAATQAVVQSTAGVVAWLAVLSRSPTPPARTCSGTHGVPRRRSSLPRVWP